MRAWGTLLSLAWLCFLVPAFVSALRLGTTPGYAAALLVLVFAACYIWAMRGMRVFFVPSGTWTFGRLPWLAAGMVALTAVLCLLVPDIGTATFPYLSVVASVLFTRRALWAIVGVAAAATLVERVIYGEWEDPNGVVVGTLVSGFAVWCFVLLMLRNQANVATAEAQAKLALANQRERFARDLHDILGHSLTVVSVKAELAGRLLEDGRSESLTRARREIVDIERLARDALADVRATAAGYRDVSLPGELARARSALSAAGIDAHVPNASDEVAGSCRELFAWAVREGVTNVLRHSSASRCTITLAPHGIVISDDGRGDVGGGPDGHGLVGLRERAAALGATVSTGPGVPQGFVLRVEASPAVSTS